MTTQLETEITDQSIKLLVDHFYAKVVDDDVIGPVFRRVIGESLDEWQEHLLTMYRFWSSVMLTSGRYKGNPMAKHMALHDVEPHFFDRWLALWDEATGEIFVAPQADRFRTTANRIAESFKLGMFYRPDQIHARPAANG